MTTKLSDAVAEAGPFLALLEESQDKLDVTLLASWNYPPLTLGTVRALYELAAEICAAAGQCDLELLQQEIALARERG
jgi:hypothetical protein